MIKNTWLVMARMLFGLLCFSALVTEMAVLADRGTLQMSNFFSFFTVQNNILVSITLFVSAVYAATGRRPRWLDRLRAAVTVYILLVGLGFAALLSGLENAVLTAVPWDNVVLHYIMPIVMAIDYLIDRPKRKLSFGRCLVWLLYPLAYLIYSLVRGNITGWYPYPFLNPANNGYGGIAMAAVGLAVLTAALTYGVCIISSRNSRQSAL